MHPVQKLCEVVGGRFLQKGANHDIRYLLHDSRRVSQGEASLFFALKTSHGNGHTFVKDAYGKGVRNFIIHDPVPIADLHDANVISVDDTLQALQSIAAYHRSLFSIPVIGITGSNGKTIVKEWLYQLLKEDIRIVRSPKSYNSQIGVALSVWQMDPVHELAIFEAGISQPGEMDALQRIIQPGIGILTNIGEAHDAYFSSKEQKLQEKLRLFQHARVLIGPHALIGERDLRAKKITWGTEPDASLRLLSVTHKGKNSEIEAAFEGESFQLQIPFTDEASVQNAAACLCLLFHLGVDPEIILQRFKSLHPVDMRLQLKHANNNCLLINDSYSADTTSLKIALDFLQQQSTGLTRTLILSDFAESGKDASLLYEEVGSLIRAAAIEKLIVIGPDASHHLSGKFDQGLPWKSYASTADFISEFRASQYFREIILLKGARVFEFERIASLFEKKVHQTVLEIDLNALAHNLKEYQRLLKPGTKMMAMVKAFSYGSGGAEIASVLQYHNVHYLGVAYADEGVELVKSGIRMPIMVMNAEESSFASIVGYSLQPVIYSMELLRRLEDFLASQGVTDHPVHIEIETGMNRLGFRMEEVPELARHLSGSGHFKVQSVFSHLAASEDPSQDDFTAQQADLFQKAAGEIRHAVGYPFLKHISNSAAILRHPHLQMDMVRLGIGLYGIETVEARALDLQPVATLRSTIAQVKHIRKGESVSYNRRWVAEKDSVIATVRIGYADGYSRQFGNGVGKMLAGGVPAPVVGSVCMDMTMIDLTGIEGLKEGDDVIVFGRGLPVQQLAAWGRTIPYEILTSVSHRVKRVYFHE